MPSNTTDGSGSSVNGRTFGFHPLLGFVDHGGRHGGGGEPVAELLRPGKAGSNTAADHITVLDAALAQLPAALRARDDARAGARCWCAPTPPAPPASSPRTWPSTGVEFSVGASFAHLDMATALALLPKTAWTPAYQARKPRAAETRGADRAPRRGLGRRGHRPASTCPAGRPGTRLILRKERPHPGAQLRITDADGHARSPGSSPTPPTAAPAASSPTSNCGTAATPASRTASFSGGSGPCRMTSHEPGDLAGGAVVLRGCCARRW